MSDCEIITSDCFKLTQPQPMTHHRLPIGKKGYINPILNWVPPKNLRKLKKVETQKETVSLRKVLSKLISFKILCVKISLASNYTRLKWDDECFNNCCTTFRKKKQQVSLFLVEITFSMCE